MPFFSVVIPLFNKEETIVRAINSVLAQTFADFELLVIDDGSIDQSYRIVSSFKDERMRVLRQVNSGAAAARNKGISLARAENIGFLDGDDTWHPEFLAEIYRTICMFPNAGLFCSGYAFRRLNREFTPSFLASYSAAEPCLVSYFDLVARGEMVATSSSVCVRSSVLRSLGAFPPGERIGEDQDLWARIALHYSVALNPRVLAFYFQDAPNMATRMAPEKEVWPFVERLARFLESGAVSEEKIPAIERYLECQLIGQASQLVLAGQVISARRLLEHRIVRTHSLRRRIWWAASFLPHAMVQSLYKGWARWTQ